MSVWQCLLDLFQLLVARYNNQEHLWNLFNSIHNWPITFIEIWQHLCYKGAFIIPDTTDNDLMDASY